MSKIEKDVRNAIALGASIAAADDGTKMIQSDVGQVTTQILAQVEPVITYATNREPWYQSRVTIGNYVAMASTVVGPLIGIAVSPEDQAMITTVVTGIGVIGGALYSLYGRWRAKKALGS